MNTLFKITATMLLLAAYLLLSCVIGVLPATNRLRRALRTRVVSFFSRRFLSLLGIRVHVRGPKQPTGGSGRRLVVSNHVSYLDVLVLSSLLPSIFITSVELKRTPVLGTLARCGGSLFVERRNPAGLKQEIVDIANALDQGFPVVLFPEGTTSNGDCVRQFKNSLFDAAVATGSDVLPFCLRYTKINGEPVSPGNRDAVFYYGGMTFFKHLPGLLSQKSIDVEVIPLATIGMRADVTRKELAALAYNAICAAYQAGQGPEGPCC